MHHKTLLSLFFVLLAVMLAFSVGGCRTQPPTPQTADVVITLETAMVEGSMDFVGANGEIENMANPDLIVKAGDVVRLAVVNGDGMAHDIAFPDLNVHTPLLTAKGQATEVVFQAREAGEFAYYCTVSGHRQLGMEGRLIVKAQENQ